MPSSASAQAGAVASEATPRRSLLRRLRGGAARGSCSGPRCWSPASSSTASSSGPAGCRSPSRACCRATSSPAWSSTSRCSATTAGGSRCATWPSSAACSSSSAWPSDCCWPSCSTSASAPRASCARSTCTRWRLSFIVTGTAWKWILNPGLGLEHVVQQLGFGELHLRLAGQPGDVDLHRGHRRRLAVVRVS